MQRHLYLTFVLLILSLGLTACGDTATDSSPDTSTTKSTDGASAPSGAPAEPAPSGEGAEPSGDVVLPKYRVEYYEISKR